MQQRYDGMFVLSLVFICIPVLTTIAGEKSTDLPSTAGSLSLCRDNFVGNMATRITNRERAKAEQQRNRTKSGLEDQNFGPDSRITEDLIEDQMANKMAKNRKKNEQIGIVEAMIHVIYEAASDHHLHV